MPNMKRKNPSIKAVKINPIYWCIASNSRNNTKNSRCIQTRTHVSRMRN